MTESVLPSSWIEVDLGELRVDRSQSLDPARAKDEEFDLYSIPAHDAGTVERLRGREIGSTKKLLEPGTVILSKINPRISRVGVVGPNRGRRQLGSSEWIAFSPRDGLAPDYLAWYLRQEHVRAYLANNVSGVGGSLMRTNKGAVDRLRLPLAPEKEQTRVVEAIENYLSRLDDAVASLQRAQARLKVYRASVLKAAVEGRLVPTEAALARGEKRDYEPAQALLRPILAERHRRWEKDELAKMIAAGKPPTDDRWKRRYQEPPPVDTSRLPALPEGWCWATVEQVGDVLLGRQRAPQYLTGAWSRPYLRVANVKDDKLDLADVEQMDFDPVHFEKYRLRPGDILVSEGQSPHLCGQSAIYRGGVQDLCFQKTLHRFRPFAPGPSSEFAQLVFRANVKSGVYKAIASITTNIAHLTLEKFRQSRFPLPPAAEQDRIVSETARLLSVGDALEGEIETNTARTTRLRQSILSWAFLGKLADYDPNEDAAAGFRENLRARVLTERSA